MSGPVALHGGGEFQAGDEPFLAAILASVARRLANARPIRVAIVPTAAARGRPDLAAAHGVAAFERVAAAGGVDVEAGAVAVLDAGSAEDPGLAARLAEADVIHFPGGDPDLIPTILPGSAAWAAIERARDGGAVLAGASAGAMALASWTWTPRGGIAGLGVVPGLIVLPHADEASFAASVARYAPWAPRGLGLLGLAERTAIVTDGIPKQGTIRWRVVGPGSVQWQAGLDAATISLVDGETLETPAARND